MKQCRCTSRFAAKISLNCSNDGLAAMIATDVVYDDVANRVESGILQLEVPLRLDC